ncbi:MAG: imelysin family protein [Bacteroidota bacterium]
MRRKIYFLSTSILVVSIMLMGLWSCNRNTDPPTVESFEREAMLQNIADNVILPTHRDFAQEAASLNTRVSTFAQDPTQANLEAAQQQWMATKRAWKRCELFNVGEAKQGFLHNPIDKWPTNTDFLEENLADNDALDQDFVEGTGSTSKGLPALEYFLFAENGLTDFTTDSLAAKRQAYIQGLAANLNTRAQVLVTTWEDGKDAFVANIENFSRGSINELVNTQVGVLEKVIGDKLGKPLGKSNGGTPEPDRVEAPYSQVSLSLIQENLQGLKAAFTGTQTAPGFDDLLDHVEAQSGEELLSEVILAQLDLCIDEANALNDPLATRVTDQASDVDALSESIRTLLGFIKVDMANNLGILITFNDTDGD